MLTRWLTGLETVKRATTPEERQAIYRFRYSVYVEELGRELGGADHTKKTVSDHDDEMDFSIHLCTGGLDALTGSVRVRAWAPGRIPDEDFELLSMELFPDIRNQAVSELGRLMIRPTMRGKLVLPSLARAVYKTAVEKGCDLSFCYCAPGLVQHYRKLGFRPYAAPLVPTVDGMHVGLIAVLSDASYLRRMSSPVAGLVKKYYGPGKRRPFKLESLGDVLDLQAAPVEMQPDRIWDEVQQEFLHEEQDTPSFLESLSESSVKLMTRKGFIIDVKQGTLVTKEGYGEREMFIILDGVFEVLSSNGRRLAVMDKW